MLDVLDREFPIPLDDEMTRMAVMLILAGAVVIRFAGWMVVGWVLVGLGIAALWLAHQFAVAPYDDQPGEFLLSL